MFELRLRRNFHSWVCKRRLSCCGYRDDGPGRPRLSQVALRQACVYSDDSSHCTPCPPILIVYLSGKNEQERSVTEVGRDTQKNYSRGGQINYALGAVYSQASFLHQGLMRKCQWWTLVSLAYAGWGSLAKHVHNVLLAPSLVNQRTWGPASSRCGTRMDQQKQFAHAPVACCMYPYVRS